MIPQALGRRTSIRHKSLGEPIEAMDNPPAGCSRRHVQS
jgi:hypothetical protein